MITIEVKMKDGSRREFPHRGRAGGSYSNEIRYEGGFAIITDEYDNEIAFPSQNIVEVRVVRTR